MIRYQTYLMIVALAIGLLILGRVPMAHAVLMLELDDLGIAGVEVAVVDNGVGDLDLAVGKIVYNGIAGGFNLNVTTGLSKPQIGGPNLAEIDLLSVHAQGVGTLDVRLTDTGYLLPAGVPVFSVESNIGGTTDGAVWAQSFFGPTNVAFPGIYGAGILTANVGPLGPGGFSADTISWVPSQALPFAIAQVVTVTHTGQLDTTSYNYEVEITPVPEPSTILLLGLGIFGFGAFAWRRQRKHAA